MDSKQRAKKKYYESSKGKEANKRSRIKNKLKFKLYQEKYRSTPEYRLYNSNYCKNRNKEKKLEAINILGGKCVKCDFSDIRALQIDHINGGGNVELKYKTSRSSYLKSVIESFLNNENKYQVLCANCNWIKRYENNENGQYIATRG